VNWEEGGSVVVDVEEQSYRGRPCQSEPFSLVDALKPDQAGQALVLSPDGRFRARTEEWWNEDGTREVTTTIEEAGKEDISWRPLLITHP
jgi:hypothetical protein